MLTHLRNYTRLENSRIYENRRENPPFSYTFCNHQLFLLESFYTSSVNKVEDEMAKKTVKTCTMNRIIDLRECEIKSRLETFL